MAKGNREAFTLNELNPKEKVIFDFLQTQYNKSQVIKDILYEYIMVNDLQLSTQSIPKKNVINTKECIKDVSNVYTDLPQDNIKDTGKCIKREVKLDKSKQKDNKNNDNDFSIDLNNIDDKEVEVNTGEKQKNGTENAMDFIFNM